MAWKLEWLFCRSVGCGSIFGDWFGWKLCARLVDPKPLSHYRDRKG